MELKNVLSRLEKSTEYNDWRPAHPKAFLAHAFVMLDEANKNAWQVGYFDEAANLMSTFVIGTTKIELIPDQEVLKADRKILPLRPEEVMLPVAEALAIAQQARIEHYPQEQPAKTFFIIQCLEAHGTVFNITFFTTGLRTINIKLSTKDGKVVHHSAQSLASFG